MNLFAKALTIGGVVASCLFGGANAAEGPVPVGIARLDHVFLIMMENHAYAQVIGNANMPFVNGLIARAGLATNYFAVAHPSLTNYLEIVGGSNFGVLNDNSPDWQNGSCQTNLSSGLPSLDDGKHPPICPIHGTGTDAATPAIDYSNETSGPPGDINVNGSVSFAAVTNTTGKTIADQLTAHGLSWKAYEESLPPSGAQGVDVADGLFSNLFLPTATNTGTNPAQGVLGLYAVKHNPFAYFANIQTGTNPSNSLRNIVGWSGSNGLWQDLVSGELPNLVYVVPNQCHDQHGRSAAGPECDYDATDNGTLTGLNPGAMYDGDVTLETLVRAIKNSPAWYRGRNAIVIVWDENDYSTAPTTNQVAVIVDTNESRDRATRSNTFYTHFSLLKTMESGFGLPCLNHACDATATVMADLFPNGH